MRTEGSFYKKIFCRLCESDNLKEALKLTPTPPGNNFLREENLGLLEETFPLELYFCEDCKHIQLGHVVEPEFLFQNNYTYVSSTSNVFVEHLKNYVNSISERLKLTQNSFVVDIGSNDGTCLSFFKQKQMKILGVDPAKEVSDVANANGIDTLNEFFSKDIAFKIKKKYGKADLITSHNACAHIDDLRGVIDGVDALMGSESIFVMEVGYFLDVFQNKWFDTIYHEHVDFHTVAPLKKLFDSYGMEVFDVERIAPQGGSIRVMVQRKKGKFSIEESVDKLVNLETQCGLDKLETFKVFENEINSLKKKFKDLLKDLKNSGKTIAAFGAPTKATTLSYFFDIDADDVDFIVDDNPLKQGLYSPGKHIPVLDSSSIYEKKPDVLIILAWNFAEDIMLKHKRYGEEVGTFLIPMPLPRLVNTIN
jgi:SAM-dependent methyltransferase